MKVCIKCGLEHDDALAKCSCGSTSFAPIVPAIANDAAASAAPSEPPPSASDGAATATGATAAETSGAREGEPAEPETSNASRRVERPSSAGRGAAEIEATTEQLARMRADDWFTVGLIGFPTAGKTWFLNRIKERFSEGEGAYTVDPERVAPGHEVPGSTRITVHKFALPQFAAARPGVKGMRSFDILDIPGEALERAIDRLARSGDVELGADVVLEAFHACDALVIMMPADELLFSRKLADSERMRLLSANPEGATLELDAQIAKVKAELAGLGQKVRPGRTLSKVDAARKVKLDAELARLEADYRGWLVAQSALNVDRFSQNLGKFAAILHLLREGPASELARLRSSDILDAITKQKTATAIPVLFVLSKMDSLRRLDPEMFDRLKAMGVDPEAIWHVGEKPGRAVRTYAPGVAQRLAQHFSWLKFECVSAFVDQPQGDLTIHYNARRHHGVSAIIEWINCIEAFSSGAQETVWEVRWARRIGPER